MDDNSSIGDMLSHHGVSRRKFLKFCGFMAAVLMLPGDAAGTLAAALAAAVRPRVIWLEGQDCTGDSEAFLRAAKRADPFQAGVTDPNLTSLLLDVLSVEYHETLMVPAGAMAIKSRDDVVKAYPGQYICIVEGSIPTGANGVYCTVGGRTVQSIVKDTVSHAKATIALGTCAAFGGLAGAAPNPTGALGVGSAVPGLANLVNIPGCPSNEVNLVATLVYFLAHNAMPALDALKRPTFAFGQTVHSRCERRSFYSSRYFALAWGDKGHRQGWCLNAMGCRGPDTYANCPTVKFNESTCWPVAAGHGCIGCTTPNFWDGSSPFYNVVHHGSKTQDECAQCHSH